MVHARRRWTQSTGAKSGMLGQIKTKVPAISLLLRRSRFADGATVGGVQRIATNY